MKNQENGNSARSLQNPHFQPREYYLPTSRARDVTHYHQKDRDDEEALGVEVLDYSIISVLQITGLSFPDLSIESVEADTGFPLSLMVQNNAELFSEVTFPVRLGYGASLCLLLNAPALAGELPKRCYGQKPEKITVHTPRETLVFEAKS